MSIPVSCDGVKTCVFMDDLPARWRDTTPHLRARLVCRQARRLAQLSNATVASNSTKPMTCSILPPQGMATLRDATLTYSAQAHVGFRGPLHPSRTSALDIA